MEPYQQRVIDEKESLDDKIHKLSVFLGSASEMPPIPDDEQGRLKRQLGVMREYSTILGERIENFTE